MNDMQSLTHKYNIKLGKLYKAKCNLSFYHHFTGKDKRVYYDHNKLTLYLSSGSVIIPVALKPFGLASSKQHILLCLYNKRLYLYHNYAQHFHLDFDLVE